MRERTKGCSSNKIEIFSVGYTESRLSHDTDLWTSGP